MIRLVCSDLDGTLLENGKLPDGVFHLIKELKSMGIHFAAASGREYSNLQRLFLPVHDSMDYIACNGAICVVDGIITHFVPFLKPTALEIIRDIRERGMDLLVSGKHTTYVLDENRTFTDEIIYRLRNTVTVIHSIDEICEPLVKISAHSSEIEAFTGEILRKWSERVTTTVSGKEWIDWTVANKGDGVQRLMEHLKLHKEETAAFGDYYNDETMLDSVGYPFVMENAEEAMKKPQYTVCAHVPDVLRQLIETGGTL